MPATRPIQKRFDKPDRPCPCCGASSRGCSATDDEMYLCRGEPSRDDWREISRGPDKAGFRHFRRADEPRPERNGFHGNGRRAGGGAGVSTTASRSKPQPAIDWAALNAEFVANLTPEDTADLAGSLRLPVDALADLEVGVEWIGETRVFTFPEQNGRGETVGISRRYPDGTKRMIPGSRRGLSIPRSFRDRGGDTYVVEGSTCMLAGSAADLRTVGRPSNIGGVEDLAELLADFPRDRGIVVIAENDEKPDGKWPGKAGAESTAKALAEKLGRPVRIAFPPDGYKDTRDRIADLIADACEVLDLAAIGREFVGSLKFAAPTRGRDWSKLFITSAEFAVRDTRPNWLVKQVLVWDQPAVFAGPQKVLKTSFLVDLVISLASGTPFLGRFETSGPIKCGMLTGESGDDTVKRTAIRICEAKGLEFASIADRVVWCFEVPSLTDPDDLGSLVDYLAAQGVKVAVIDPLYLSLLAGNGDGPDAKSLYEMGPTFRRVAMEFKARGITLVLAHHSNRRIESGKPMELENLAYSGISEFMRQWLLLSRRKKYAGDGRHELWLNVGGSAGQSGLYAADINEGTLNDDFSGRVWEIEIRTAADLEGESVEATSTSQDEKARKQNMKDERDVLAVLRAEVEAGNPGATKKNIRDKHPRLDNSKRLNAVIDRLIERGSIEEIDFPRAGGKGSAQSVTGYREVEK